MRLSFHAPLSLLLLLPACFGGPFGDDDDATASASDGETTTSGGSASASGTGSGSGSSSSGTTNDTDGECYADTQVGCTHVTWQDVVDAIDFLYLFQSTYYGYTKSEALELAKQVYDNGVVPGSYLQIIAAYPIAGGVRAHVVVTMPDGHPQVGLAIPDFEVVVDGGAVGAPVQLSSLATADPESVEVDLSLVIDDSGSVADCDANFVAKGLAVLIEALPPVYSASVVKFATHVFFAEARTSDADALIDAVLHFCTDRGSTSLWDATLAGLKDLPDVDALEAVVVFTDGLDNDSSESLETVILAAQQRSAPVFTLGLGYADIFALTKLAQSTGGGFVYVPSGDKILEGFDTLTEFIDESYVVDIAAEGTVTSVEIRALLEGGTVKDSALVQ